MATRRPRGRKRTIAVEVDDAQDTGGASMEHQPASYYLPQCLCSFCCFSFFRYGRPGHVFTTPVRPPAQRRQLLTKTDRTTPRNSTSRSIYTPLVRFLTPSKESEWIQKLIFLTMCGEKFDLVWLRTMRRSKLNAALRFCRKLDILVVF